MKTLLYDYTPRLCKIIYKALQTEIAYLAFVLLTNVLSQSSLSYRDLKEQILRYVRPLPTLGLCLSISQACKSNKTMTCWI